MDAKQLQRLRIDLGRYLDDVLTDLGRQGRRPWAELLPARPATRRLTQGAAGRYGRASPCRIDRTPHDYEQGLQQFLSQSPWDEPLPSATSWHATWAAPWATRAC